MDADGMVMADGHDLDSESDGFPLNIDLSSYVGVPARCRVWVRTSARKVRWLVSRVRRAARLRGPLLLIAGECLLPPGEPLRIIRPDDTLSVARVEHKWQRPFSCHEDEDAPTEHPPAAESTRPAKLVSEMELTPLEKPSQPAKQKHIPHEPVIVEQPSVKPALEQHTQSPATEQTSEEPVIEHEKLKRVKQRALALLQQVAGEETEQDVVDAPKKKRRRVRRRRPCREVNLDLSVEADIESTVQRSELQSIPSKQDECMEVAEETSNAQGSELQPQTSQSILTPSQVSLSMAAVSAPSPMILTYPPPSALVRNTTPPRAPRVVRALNAEPPPIMEAALVSTN